MKAQRQLAANWQYLETTKEQTPNLQNQFLITPEVPEAAL